MRRGPETGTNETGISGNLSAKFQRGGDIRKVQCPKSHGKKAGGAISVTHHRDTKQNKEGRMSTSFRSGFTCVMGARKLDGVNRR